MFDWYVLAPTSLKPEPPMRRKPACLQSVSYPVIPWLDKVGATNGRPLKPLELPGLWGVLLTYPRSVNQCPCRSGIVVAKEREQSVFAVVEEMMFGGVVQHHCSWPQFRFRFREGVKHPKSEEFVANLSNREAKRSRSSGASLA